MKVSSQSFIYTGHDKVTHRVAHVHVVMTPLEKQPQINGSELDIRYKVTAKVLNPIAYWFMTRLLKYEVR